VTKAHRRAAHSLVRIPAIVGVLVVFTVGCGPAVAVPTPRSTTGTLPTEPALTPVPAAGANAQSPAPSISQTETKTAIGRIWDGLPPSFPKLPGQTESEIGSATSGLFVANVSGAAASQAIENALKAQGWAVDVGSPLEDGTIVLEATGQAAACKAEVRFTPQSGIVTMAVLYGAACPFG
jgi:hypothetical protein